MSCHEVEDKLSDYVDGSLSEAEFQEMELHLASCAACRTEERAMRSLLAEAAALPRSVEPSRDLWPGIAGRISAGNVARMTPRSSWATAASLAAAAAVLLAIAASLQRRGPVVPQVAGGTQASLPVSAVPVALQPAEGEYLRATAELMEALATRRARLAPETLVAVDRNLRIIDTALEDLRLALRKDPNSQKLAHMLAATHQRKIEVLRRVVNVKV